jgi:hypothetical protein
MNFTVYTIITTTAIIVIVWHIWYFNFVARRGRDED